MACPAANRSPVDTTLYSDLLTFAFEHVSSYDKTKPIYIDAECPERALNRNQCRTLVRKVIGGLKAAALKEGDCVLVILANNFLYSPIYFSIIGAGGVYFGANPASQIFELNHLLELSEPKFVITSKDILPKVLQTSVAQTHRPEHIFVLDPETFPLPVADQMPLTPPLSRGNSSDSKQEDLHTDFVCLTQHGESDWVRFSDATAARSTPAAMFSTSGTSGLPKAAVISHHALIQQQRSLELVPSYEVLRLISLPFFHLFAALFAHIFPLRLGQPLHILPRFQMEQYLHAIHRFKITDTVMAPPIVHALNRSSFPLQELLSTIRWIGVGGAPIAAEGMQTFRAHLSPSATLSQVWGMTEIGVATLVRYPEQHCDGSIGRPLPGFHMKLVDSFGKTVESDNEPGELYVQYDGMMTGYKNQTPVEKGGWFATGDIVTRTDGKFYVVGRSKELIKVNGWQVAPAELEAVLLTHPCISDVGVIGVLRDNGDTEVPRAYVVRSGDPEGRCSKLSAEEIFDFARERLASYKALHGGIFFVDHIPRTASGKIQRFKLAQMDHYRRSVTELLVHNNSTVAEQKWSKIHDLKASAEERRIRTRRSSRIAASQSSTPSMMSLLVSPKVFKKTSSKRRSRASLVDKMKALEASRVMVDGGGGNILTRRN